MDKIFSEIKTLIDYTEVYTFQFSLKDLPYHDNYNFNIRSHPKFKNFFEDLNKKTNHCLYWFSTDTYEQCDNLKKLTNEKRGKLKFQIDKRVVPVNNPNENSNVLYVGVKQGGKRKHTIINRKRVKDELSCIGGRMIHHLGYYRKGSTQGLQLLHVKDDLDVKITVNIIEYGNIPKSYLYILEKIYAIKLKPLLGVH